MKVYIVTNEGHADTSVDVYINKAQAIRAAAQLTASSARDLTDIKVFEIEKWLYYAEYSCEGNSVRVEEKELIEPVPPVLVTY